MTYIEQFRKSWNYKTITTAPFPHFTDTRFRFLGNFGHWGAWGYPIFLSFIAFLYKNNIHLTSPHLTSPHLTSPHLTSHYLTLPHITFKDLV